MIIRHYSFNSLPGTSKNGKNVINKRNLKNSKSHRRYNRKYIYFINHTSVFSKRIFVGENYDNILILSEEETGKYSQRLLKNSRFISSVIYHNYENK